MDKHQTFEIERFRKLYTLATSEPHEGDNRHERETARRLAEAIAARSGLTWDEAVKKVKPADPQARAWTKPKPPEFREHPWERRLRETFGDLPVEAVYLMDDARRAEVRAALPWPGTIREAVAELATWDRLIESRRRVNFLYNLGGAAYARYHLVFEFVIDERANTLADAVARARWYADHMREVGCDEAFDAEMTEAIAKDLARLAERMRDLTRENESLRQRQAPASPHRRNRDKRADIETILREPGGDRLTLRQIAERAGVSPETVRRVKAEMRRAS